MLLLACIALSQAVLALRRDVDTPVPCFDMSRAGALMDTTFHARSSASRAWEQNVDVVQRVLQARTRTNHRAKRDEKRWRETLSSSRISREPTTVVRVVWTHWLWEWIRDMDPAPLSEGWWLFTVSAARFRDTRSNAEDRERIVTSLLSLDPNHRIVSTLLASRAQVAAVRRRFARDRPNGPFTTRFPSRSHDKGYFSITAAPMTRGILQPLPFLLAARP
jgi:hypothetical protein